MRRGSATGATNLRDYGNLHNLRDSQPSEQVNLKDLASTEVRSEYA